MNTELFNKILDFVDANRESSSFQVTISGGEPLLHPNFMAFLKNIENRNIDYVAVSTNGSLITEELLEDVVKLNIKNILFQISMDNINENKHDEFRGFKGAYKKAWENIKLIQTLAPNIILSVKMTVTKNNISEMEDMVELCLANGVKRVAFAIVIPVGDAENADFILTSKDKTIFLNKLAYLRNKYEGIAVIMSEVPQKIAIQNSPWKYEKDVLDEKNYFSGCNAGIDAFNVGADGTVTPCPVFNEAIFNCNDMNNVEEMTEAYIKNPVILNLLERKFKGKCGKCKLYRACGGCRAIAKAVTGDYLDEDPSCEFCI